MMAKNNCNPCIVCEFVRCVVCTPVICASNVLMCGFCSNKPENASCKCAYECCLNTSCEMCFANRCVDCLICAAWGNCFDNKEMFAEYRERYHMPYIKNSHIRLDTKVCTWRLCQFAMYPVCSAVGLVLCTATVMCQCVLWSCWAVVGKETVKTAIPEDKICSLTDAHSKLFLNFSDEPLFYDSVQRELQRQEMK